MKKIILPLVLTLVLAASCSTVPEVALQVSNPMNETRNDAIILISRRISI